MKYLSLFSGIEAATVAWEPLGWEAVGFAEIEPFPAAVLKHHYPDVPNFGDVTKHKEWPHANINVLVGGSPCQAFSVAGLRKGLDDERGNLTLTYLSVVDQYRPKWVVWENVPGVLSIDQGRTFGAFLGGLAELGYGFAYRVLDAQYFGVAQRRRRVFVVGHLGDWRPAAAVLFERDSLSGYPAPSREKGEENSRVAGTLAASSAGISRPGGNANELDFCVTAKTLTTKTRVDFETETLLPMSFGIDHELGVHGLDKPTGTLLKGSPTGGGHPLPAIVTGVYPLAAGAHPPASADISVRRLTPVECERLQGFPDGYTDIQPKGRATPDTPRYKALGNSMAVPVMRWIGERINSMEALNAKL